MDVNTIVMGQAKKQYKYNVNVIHFVLENTNTNMMQIQLTIALNKYNTVQND